MSLTVFAASASLADARAAFRVGGQPGSRFNLAASGRVGMAADEFHADTDTGWMVGVSGRVTSHDRALAADIRARGGATAVAGALGRGWERLLANLDGNFALAAFHEGEHILLAAVDRIGHRHLYHALDADGAVLSTSLRDLVALRRAQPAIDPQSLYDYVYSHTVPSPGTIWKGIRKLSSACCLVAEGLQVRTMRYWSPAFPERYAGDPDGAGEQLEQKLQNAVSGVLGDAKSAACFLSGGLDSSSVVGLAARHLGGTNVDAFTIGFDIASYDESAYAKLAADRFGTRWHRKVMVPDDLASCLEQVVGGFDEPFGNSSAPAVFQCAKAARDAGYASILAGDGGDELFGGNERYAKQLVFERYLSVPPSLRRGVLEPSIAALSRLTQAWPIGKAASYVRQANVPLPDRLQTYNFLHRQSASEVFDPGLLGSIDPDRPLELLRAEYASAASGDPVNRMLLLDWKVTLHDNDLVKVNTACRLAGIDVVYPMLDADLVEFSTSLPGDLKVRDGTLRWLYKRATRELLPREIIDKKKHGFGLPFGLWMQSDARLAEIATESLRSLSKRGYFRSDFIDAALRQHREGHASYFGELIWILTALELWLQRNTAAAAAAATGD